jgi:hypothetical protein
MISLKLLLMLALLPEQFAAEPVAEVPQLCVRLPGTVIEASGNVTLLGAVIVPVIWLALELLPM